MKNSQGFSLVELLVVMSIIGVLSVVGVISVTEYREGAFDARARADLKNIVSAQQAAFLDSDVYLECSNQGCNAPVLPGFTLSEGNSVECAVFDEAQTFQCGVSNPRATKIFYYTSATSVFWDTNV